MIFIIQMINKPMDWVSRKKQKNRSFKFTGSYIAIVNEL